MIANRFLQVVPISIRLSVEIDNPILFCCRPTPTCIACRIFRNSLCVGAHTPTCIACRISFRNSVLAPD